LLEGNENMTDAAQSMSHGREPEEPHGQTEPTPHHTVNYYGIFIALVILTIVTVLVAFHRFQSEFINLALAMLVATTKATLVASFFMHLKFEGKLVRMIFIIPLFLCVLMIVALIPDILLPALGNDNHSLHMFNSLQSMIGPAMGNPEH
jgi:cytochrome c oxidase subunit 4